jgi:urease accessory protein
MKEAFVFNSLHSTTKIYRDNKLILMDNQFLSPAKQPITGLLFFEGYTHQATLIFSARFAKELKEELDEILTLEYSDITFGFTRAADDIVMLRALGNDGELLYDFMGMLGQLCWDFTQHIQEEIKLKLQEEVSELSVAPPVLESPSVDTALTPVVAVAKKKRAAVQKTSSAKTSTAKTSKVKASTATVRAKPKKQEVQDA